MTSRQKLVRMGNKVGRGVRRLVELGLKAKPKGWLSNIPSLFGAPRRVSDCCRPLVVWDFPHTKGQRWWPVWNGSFCSGSRSSGGPARRCSITVSSPAWWKLAMWRRGHCRQALSNTKSQRLAWPRSQSDEAGRYRAEGGRLSPAGVRTVADLARSLTNCSDYRVQPLDEAGCRPLGGWRQAVKYRVQVRLSGLRTVRPRRQAGLGDHNGSCRRPAGDLALIHERARQVGAHRRRHHIFRHNHPDRLGIGSQLRRRRRHFVFLASRLTSRIDRIGRRLDTDSCAAESVRAPAVSSGRTWSPAKWHSYRPGTSRGLSAAAPMSGRIGRASRGRPPLLHNVGKEFRLVQHKCRRRFHFPLCKLGTGLHSWKKRA